MDSSLLNTAFMLQKTDRAEFYQSIYVVFVFLKPCLCVVAEWIWNSSFSKTDSDQFGK